jgi:DNA-directed RNA polymerase specialized sigma24 family protein
LRKKSEAQVYLERVEMIDCIIKNKLIEQQQWRDIALGITVNMDGEKVQSSGSQSRMSDAIIKCVDMEREIDNLIDELIDTKRKVISTIEQLDSPYYYRLLHMRYIQYIDFDEIAEKLHKDYNTITTAHGRALAQVQEILDRQ